MPRGSCFQGAGVCCLVHEAFLAKEWFVYLQCAKQSVEAAQLLAHPLIPSVFY